ncbi:MAG TPA: hypothetical protein VF163_00350, partial [Micromonosporaceae bacterium]
VSAAGAQTIAFVAAEAEAPGEVFLIIADPGAPWSFTDFATSAGAMPARANLLPCPTGLVAHALLLNPSIGPVSSTPVPVPGAGSTGIDGIASVPSGGAGGVAPAPSGGAGSAAPSSGPAPAPTPAVPTPAVPGPAAPGQPPAPAPPRPATTAGARPGRPVADFAGVLPYASEMFGVYQPLAGWLGRRNVERALANQPAGDPTGPRNLLNPALVIADIANAPRPSGQGVLSPVGMVNLFRQFFFEFDTFLGAPAGHVWISPGGTVEVVETSTRRTIVEKTTEQSDQSTRKSEESLTSQDDVADAVKEENANDTKLGVSATAGANFGVYHGEATGSFSASTAVKKASEQTHKHSRTQSAKVSSEIVRNFKTTYKVVTDTTDTTSRRYVVQNTTNQLVNYELRRKMRRVGVQVQHIGSRLSWQVFLDAPGRHIGLGDLVQVVPAPDLSAIRRPEPPEPLQPIKTEFSGAFQLRKYPGTKNDPHQNANYTRAGDSDEMNSDDNADHIVADSFFTVSPPAAGYTLAEPVRLIAAKTGGGDAQFQAEFKVLDAVLGTFRVRANFLNFGGGRIINLSVALTWNPPPTNPAHVQYEKDMAAYELQVAEVQQNAYAEAVRERLRLVSGLAPRPTDDLRREERHLVYGRLLDRLELSADPHLDSELIRQIFDVDEMLYFAAPDYWRPGPTATEPNATSRGRYPVPQLPNRQALPNPAQPLAGDTVASWYSHTDQNVAFDPGHNGAPEWRVNYLITEHTRPAPMGSSLGWLIQTDGDERRNEFLNAAWVKVVLPIRPGHEEEALDWLTEVVEGDAGFDQQYPVQPGDPQDYQGRTIGEVMRLLAKALYDANTNMANTLASEKVFEHGFDPLEGGFRPAEPYQVFDQWVEVLPTDQIVAVQVDYDPKTGQQR